MLKIRNSNKGFTLIELLVVIAIIGILSSVVLASLNSARNKGADTTIKAQLSNMGPSFELWYDDHTSSYSGFFGSQTWTQAAAVLLKASGTAPAHSADDPASWAVYSVLKNPPTGSPAGWCADYSGFLGASAGITGSGGNTPYHCQ